MAKNQPMPPPAGDEIFLLKMGEMVLKGLNRRTFEERLMGNARRRVEKFGKFRIYSRQSITYIEPKTEDSDKDGAFETLTRLFGVVGLSRAKACEKPPEAILATAKTYLHDDLMAARRFKVESKRSDKSFPLTSIQLSQFVGGELNEAFPHIVADMHTPDLIVHVEVRDFAAYVHANPTPGAGGLPVGVGGHAVSLLSGGIDSPVASWMMAKRGLALEMVHFFSYPYTSPDAKEKVLDLARLLADMIESDKYGYYHATNEGGYISWYDFACEIFRQAGLPVQVDAVTTAEYGASKAARPFNSRLDKSKLAENGFTPLPEWKDALSRYLRELGDNQ